MYSLMECFLCFLSYNIRVFWGGVSPWLVKYQKLGKILICSFSSSCTCLRTWCQWMWMKERGRSVGCSQSEEQTHHVLTSVSLVDEKWRLAVLSAVQGFSAPAPLMPRAGNPLLWGCPLHCRMLSSIAGLCAQVTQWQPSTFPDFPNAPGKDSPPFPCPWEQLVSLGCVLNSRGQGAVSPDFHTNSVSLGVCLYPILQRETKVERGHVTCRQLCG